MFWLSTQTKDLLLNVVGTYEAFAPVFHREVQAEVEALRAGSVFMRASDVLKSQLLASATLALMVQTTNQMTAELPCGKRHATCSYLLPPTYLHSQAALFGSSSQHTNVRLALCRRRHYRAWRRLCGGDGKCVERGPRSTLGFVEHGVIRSRGSLSQRDVELP